MTSLLSCDPNETGKGWIRARIKEISKNNVESEILNKTSDRQSNDNNKQFTKRIACVNG